MFLLAALGLGGVYGISALHNPSPPAGPLSRPPPLPDLPLPAPPPPLPLNQQMQLRVNGWAKGGFDNVGLVDLTLKSWADFAVKDAVILCDFKGDSGTIINRRRKTIFKQLGPGASLRERKLNFGIISPQASQIVCLVEEINRA